jgi:hypothetical protein
MGLHVAKSQWSSCTIVMVNHHRHHTDFIVYFKLNPVIQYYQSSFAPSNPIEHRNGDSGQ